MATQTVTIYWAGDLFDFKDLAGNVEIAAAVEAQSGSRYQVKLPQLSESNSKRSVTAIRDADLELLINSDAIVANFDGSDLDSGTVVEFCFAKMLDMPGVLLRTDFRTGSDQSDGGEPWNLMCSGYPRTASLVLNGMKLFHHHWDKAGSRQEKLTSYRNDIARRVIAALDKCAAEKPLFSPGELVEHYLKIITAAGGTLPELFPRKRVEALVAEKAAKWRQNDIKELF